jgi:hypothetical protein
MKTTLLVLFILCAATAFGQLTGSISSQPLVVQVPDHPQHAEPHAMAAERFIVGGGSNTYTVAQGERPLWEFGPVSETPSLGDVARAYRKDKLTAKKAHFVFEKQGS